MEKKEVWEVLEINAAKRLASSCDLYVVDNILENTIYTRCPCVFIDSSRPQNYKDCVKQGHAWQYWFPIWSAVELEQCREKCHPSVSEAVLGQRFKLYGGVARIMLDQRGFHPGFEANPGLGLEFS